MDKKENTPEQESVMPDPLNQEVDENELDAVAGGVDVNSKCNEVYLSCSSTHVKNENCWVDDQCNHQINYYKGEDASSKGGCWLVF